MALQKETDNLSIEQLRELLSYNPETGILGLFRTPEEAYAAYCRAAVQFYGEFARFE